MKKKTETNNSKSNLNRLAEVLQESITNKDHLRNSPVLSNKDKACTTRVYCKQAPSHRQIFNVSFGKATQEDVAWIMEILRKVINVRVSRVLLIKRAIEVYKLYLVEMVAKGGSIESQKDFIDLLSEVEIEREALLASAGR